MSGRVTRQMSERTNVMRTEQPKKTVVGTTSSVRNSATSTTDITLENMEGT